MAFKFNKLGIPDVVTIEPQLFSDNRGFFFENFKELEFAQNGITGKFVQDNFSHSTYGVLRGLHYQKNPHAQAKLLSVLRGKIFDVAVDIRVNSPTFGKWVSEIISEEDHKLIYIPEGFAHGFCVLSNEADVLYKVTSEYSPNDEMGIIWNDPDINIAWPIDKPILHEKDSCLPLLKHTDRNFPIYTKDK